MSKVIIGAGTGRCGTMSLSRLLSIQANTRASHEMGTKEEGFSVPVNVHTPGRFVFLHNKISNCKADVFADVSFYWTFSMEEIIKKYDAKIVYLYRPGSEVVPSFEKKAGKRNHWQEHDGSQWEKHMYDVCFPKYPSNLTRAEAITCYWDDCMKEALRVSSLYKNNVRIFSTANLSDEQQCIDLLKWLGYESPVFENFVLNKNK